MKTWFAAVITVGLAVAVGLIVVARWQTALGQAQRNADEQAQLQIGQAELLDKIRELQAQKVAIEERAQGLQAELRAVAADQDHKLKDMELREKALAKAKWEYKVFTLVERDDEANDSLAKTAENGWEYVGIVTPAVPPTAVAAGSKVTNYPAIPPRLLFKRVKK